jgi:hypothetical protein
MEEVKKTGNVKNRATSTGNHSSFVGDLHFRQRTRYLFGRQEIQTALIDRTKNNSIICEITWRYHFL